MLGIDTNVLVRFLVPDDSEQFERARRLIKREVASDEEASVSSYRWRRSGCYA